MLKEKGNLKLGILGGGQLAKMLASAAQNLGLNPVILANKKSDPAAQICPQTVLGSIHTEESLRAFFPKIDRVIFENEFVDTTLLEKVASHFEVKFSPDLSAIEMLKNKIHQKKILQELEIPSAKYFIFPHKASISSWLDQVETLMDHKKFVLKWSTLGYDGKGTLLPNTREKAIQFCEEAVETGVEFFAEQYIPFKQECAILGCYSTKGEFKSYPLVLSEQWKGICRTVIGPASKFGIENRIEELAAEYAQRLAKRLNLYGIFAIEFFISEEGHLLVNEIAPRVHNTGHYTLDYSETSQFENHIRATLGIKLGNTGPNVPSFLMYNLLGPRSSIAKTNDLFQELPDKMHLHWYNKEPWKPYRKLGHVNASCKDPKKMEELKENIKKRFEDF